MTGNAGHGEPSPEQRRALFRVVRGTPTDAELAALALVVLAGATAADPAATTAPRSAWAERGSLMRRPLQPGPDAWRMSAWPR